MSNIKLLDCTLRDGGYINDWAFGRRTIRSIVKSLVRSNIDLIEIGFLRDCEYDPDKTLYNNVAEAKNNIPQHTGMSKIFLMALHNQYDIRKLEPNDETIAGIRVTFHDYDVDEGLAFVKAAMDKGYDVFCNPINIMGYSDSQILGIIEKVNALRPYGFSIVDTFGSMKRRDLMRIYYLCENNLDPSIALGLHLHENMAQAFPLSQTFVDHVGPVRNCIVDGSLLGMGRVPGNLCIELIMDYMNEVHGARYATGFILDAIDNHIRGIKEAEPWGYSIEYYLSAKYNLHRNYSEYLLSTGKLTAKDIDHILSRIAPEKKTAFDPAYLDELTFEYQNCQVDDRETVSPLRNRIGDRPVLILSPGKTLQTRQEAIDAFIREQSPFVFSANFCDSRYGADLAFFSNIRRFEDQAASLTGEILTTSNIDSPHPKINYSDVQRGQITSSNCVLMLLNLLLRMGRGKVWLAGFDGYRADGQDYLDASFSTPASHRNAAASNEEVRAALSQLRMHMDINFLTESVYESE